MNLTRLFEPRLYRALHRFGFAIAALCAARLIALPAFPGAEGFGANATGGRGGSVYVVTNLNDSGPGSFRDAVSQPNRYVVFAVGGVIKITSRIVVKNNITIAGQTAPGEGVTIYGNGLSYSGANNTITRYIRIRMGVGGDSGKDAVTIANGHDIMFDHVTVSWGRDETFSISADDSANQPANITIQDCMIAMGLQTHSAGGLLQTDGGVSVIRTLYVDNHTRNPKVKGVNEFINCVVYNWGGGGAYILGDSAGQSYANIINNYFISGPDTSIEPFTRGNLNFHVYAAENYHDGNRNGVLDGALIPPSEYTTVDFQPVPYPYPTVSRLLTPAEAYAHVAVNAGAAKTRDRVDRRYIEELTSLGTLGQIPTNENDAPIDGAYPVAGGVAPVDSDADGMPDAWELATGTDPNVADHNGDLNGDGYTNLEEYLNSLAPAGVQGMAITAMTNDTGSSATDAITSDGTVVLHGTAPAGSTVTITRIGTGVIGTATAAADGTWSFDYSAVSLPEGTHPFTAVASTPSGWVTPPTPAFIVTVDATAPDAPQITSTTVDAGNLVFNGSAEPGATVTVTRAGFGAVATAVADASGLWSTAYSGPTLSPGTYSFTAAAVDLAGNAGADSAPYAVDTSLAAPVFTSITTDSGALSTDQITNDTTLILNGTATAGQTVTLTRAGIGVIGSVTAAADGSWSFDYTAVALPAGVHTFSATAGTGGTSSPSSAPFVVTIDTTAPKVSSINRLDPTTAATMASTLTYRVTFTEAVSGVDSGDFTLTASGASGTISTVSAGSGSVIDVTVTGASGDGTLRLDLKSSGTGIVDVAGNAISGGFTTGQTYTIRLPGSGVWISTEPGDLWSDAFSWENGAIADGAGATADFSTLDVDSAMVVELDSPRTLGRLIFGDDDTSTAADWTIDLGGNPANRIDLVAASGAPSLVVNSLGSGATANLGVGLNSTTGLAKSGSGVAVLLGANSVSGPLTVTAGVLRVGAGGNLSSTTVSINSGGAKLEVAGGTYDADGRVTITAGSSSGILVSSGTANFNGGITSTNARDALVKVTGGVLNATTLDFPRTNDSSINFGVGLVVQGGAANFGSIILGSNNSWGTASFEGGVTTVDGPFTVGRQVTKDRGGQIRVTGGTLIVNDADSGLVLVRNPGTQSQQVGRATFSGGVSLIEKITLGYDATCTAGSANLIVSGGALYVGGGGIVRNGTLSTPISLTSGTLGARADWATSLPLTLTGPTNIEIKAADVADAAHAITLNGALTGAGGFTKTGGGVLTLGAANTFTGGAAVAEGTLLVTGSLAAGPAVDVASGATLAGYGAINRPVVLVSGSTLVPDGGGAIATLQAAELTWNAGAAFAVDLGASGASDGVAVTGALLRGTAGTHEIALNATAGLVPGATHTIATFASTDFSDADFTVTGLPAGYAGAVSVGATALQVTIVGTPAITSGGAAAGEYGQPFSYTIVAANSPTSFGAADLPPGLALDAATGVISGIPAAAGSFPVTVSASNLAGTGTAQLLLLVAKAPASVVLDDLMATYDGAPHAATASTVPAGLGVALTYDGAADAPVNAGSHAVVATVVDPNHFGSATGTLVIAQAPQTITFPNPGTRTFGDPAFTLGAVASSGLPVSYTLVSGPAAIAGNEVTLTGAGSVTIRATQAGDDNYLVAADVDVTFTVEKATATITLGGLRQSYDGTPKPVTVTTMPADLDVVVTYDGGTAVPVLPGAYAVVATIDDANYTGSASDTLAITVAALVRHAPTLNGDVDGSVQVLSPESLTLNGNASVSGDLLVAGTPNVRVNGHPTLAGVQDAAGDAAPSNHTVTINGGAVLRYVVRRVDPIALPVVTAPSAPAGTRDVVLNRPTDELGDPATIRNLTINGNVGAVALPAAAYGNVTVNGGGTLVLGVVGSAEPAMYDLQRLTLNGSATLEISGPVVLRLANDVTFNGTVGSAAPDQVLTIELYGGGLILNGNARLYADVVAPAGTVIINGSATLRGHVSADRLTINGNGLLVEAP